MKRGIALLRPFEFFIGLQMLGSSSVMISRRLIVYMRRRSSLLSLFFRLFVLGELPVFENLSECIAGQIEI